LSALVAVSSLVGEARSRKLESCY